VLKIVRFGIVGLAQNATCYGLTLMLIWAGWTAWQAVLVLNPLAVALTFFINRSWSFSGTAKIRGQGWRYAIVYAFAYLYAVVFTWAQETAGVASWLAVIITTATSAIAIYISLRLFVFRDLPEAQPHLS